MIKIFNDKNKLNDDFMNNIKNIGINRAKERMNNNFDNTSMLDSSQSFKEQEKRQNKNNEFKNKNNQNRFENKNDQSSFDNRNNKNEKNKFDNNKNRNNNNF